VALFCIDTSTLHLTDHNEAPANQSLIGLFAAAKHAVDFLMHWQDRLLPDASSKLLCQLHLQVDGSMSASFFMPGR
jgi:hypothetical protein